MKQFNYAENFSCTYSFRFHRIAKNRFWQEYKQQLSKKEKKKKEKFCCLFVIEWIHQAPGIVVCRCYFILLNIIESIDAAKMLNFNVHWMIMFYKWMINATHSCPFYLNFVIFVSETYVNNEFNIVLNSVVHDDVFIRFFNSSIYSRNIINLS